MKEHNMKMILKTFDILTLTEYIEIVSSEMRSNLIKAGEDKTKGCAISSHILEPTLSDSAYRLQKITYCLSMFQVCVEYDGIF